MANRKRNIQMKFYVTEEEKQLIEQKMQQLPMKRFVKCFFELLTQALVNAAGNGTGKGAQNAPVDV